MKRRWFAIMLAGTMIMPNLSPMTITASAEAVFAEDSSAVEEESFLMDVADIEDSMEDTEQIIEDEIPESMLAETADDEVFEDNEWTEADALDLYELETEAEDLFMYEYETETALEAYKAESEMDSEVWRKEDAEVLSYGTQKLKLKSWSRKWFTFVAPEDGTYIFSGQLEMSTGYWDEEKGTLAEDKYFGWIDEENYEQYLSAGQQYYFYFETSDSSGEYDEAGDLRIVELTIKRSSQIISISRGEGELPVAIAGVSTANELIKSVSLVINFEDGTTETLPSLSNGWNYQNEYTTKEGSSVKIHANVCHEDGSKLRDATLTQGNYKIQVWKGEAQSEEDDEIADADLTIDFPVVAFDPSMVVKLEEGDNEVQINNGPVYSFTVPRTGNYRIGKFEAEYVNIYEYTDEGLERVVDPEEDDESGYNFFTAEAGKVFYFKFFVYGDARLYGDGYQTVTIRELARLDHVEVTSDYAGKTFIRGLESPKSSFNVYFYYEDGSKSGDRIRFSSKNGNIYFSSRRESHAYTVTVMHSGTEYSSYAEAVKADPDGEFDFKIIIDGTSYDAGSFTWISLADMAVELTGDTVLETVSTDKPSVFKFTVDTSGLYNFSSGSAANRIALYRYELDGVDKEEDGRLISFVGWKNRSELLGELEAGRQYFAYLKYDQPGTPIQARLRRIKKNVTGSRVAAAETEFLEGIDIIAEELSAELTYDDHTVETVPAGAKLDTNGYELIYIVKDDNGYVYEDYYNDFPLYYRYIRAGVYQVYANVYIDASEAGSVDDSLKLETVEPLQITVRAVDPVKLPSVCTSVETGVSGGTRRNVYAFTAESSGQYQFKKSDAHLETAFYSFNNGKAEYAGDTISLSKNDICIVTAKSGADGTFSIFNASPVENPETEKQTETEKQNETEKQTETEKSPVHVHTWSAWKDVSAATVLEKAKHTRTCSVCGISETESYGSVLPATGKLSAASFPLKLKQKTTKLTVTDMAKGDYVKSWTSGNTALVTVTGKANGTSTVTANKKKTGTAKITVTLASGKVLTATVKIQKAKVITKSIKSNVAKKLSLKKGKSVTANVLISPISSTDKVKFKTSNKKVVTVSSKGVIKAKKAGKAKITITSGKKKYVINVTVKK